MRIIDWSSDVCSSDLGLLFRYRALVQRAVEALAQLARVEGVAAPGGLDDRRQLEFDRLQRAEALAAGLALAPAADRRAVLADARVDDAGVCVLAEEAVHQRPSTIDRELRALLQHVLAHARDDLLVLRVVQH